jgi:hypothetical protein
MPPQAHAFRNDVRLHFVAFGRLFIYLESGSGAAILAALFAGATPMPQFGLS